MGIVNLPCISRAKISAISICGSAFPGAAPGLGKEPWLEAYLSSLGIRKEVEHCMMNVCNDSKNGDTLLLLSNAN